MTEINDKIKCMLLGTVTGDALGTPLEGLSKQHIKSIFKTITDYTDATPGLKGKLDQWKKPGLYSSASQLMLLLGIYSVSNRNPEPYSFMKFVKDLPDTADGEFGIFRNPYPITKYFIRKIKSLNNPSDTPDFSTSCARQAVIMIPLAIPEILSDENYLVSAVSFSLMLNKDMHSVAGSLIINILLKKILKNNISENILQLAAETTDILHRDLQKITLKLFDLNIIPDFLFDSVKDYQNIFSGILKIRDIDTAEKAVYTYVNTKIKTPITRATANHPLAIIPFSIFFMDSHLNRPSEILYRSAELGGSTSVICPLAGALSGALKGYDAIAKNLLEELVNKKRITNLAESISFGKISGELIQDFLKNEISLNSKEVQEKNAKLKHVKIKTKKPKSRQEKERQLSAHIVESWTKLDKAKWKKKSKKDIFYKEDPE